MSELEYALETIDGGTFEALAMDFLRSKGYEVHESGSTGRDGGWDARIYLGDRTGIAHVSTRSDWRTKLHDDAEKVEQLEADRDEDYDLYVFVTNQNVTGQQEIDLEEVIRDEYGWTLQLYHRDNLLGEIRQNMPEVADRYLDIDIGTDHDHRRRIEQLRDDRVDVIRNREGHAEGLPDGPVVALHVIPNGLFSQEKKATPDLPTPPILGEFVTPSVETRGKEKIAYKRSNVDAEYRSYGVLRNDGLYESADWSQIRNNQRTEEDEAWTSATVSSTSEGIDAAIIITVQRTIAALREAGFSGAAFVSVSILDAAHARLSTPKSRNDSLFKAPLLGKDVYTTDLRQVPIGEDEIIADLEPLVAEVWREFGYDEGTTSIVDGTWTGGKVRVNRETLLVEGDQ